MYATSTNDDDGVEVAAAAAVPLLFATSCEAARSAVTLGDTVATRRLNAGLTKMTIDINVNVTNQVCPQFRILPARLKQVVERYLAQCNVGSHTVAVLCEVDCKTSDAHTNDGLFGAALTKRQSS